MTDRFIRRFNSYDDDMNLLVTSPADQPITVRLAEEGDPPPVPVERVYNRFSMYDAAGNLLVRPDPMHPFKALLVDTNGDPLDFSQAFLPGPGDVTPQMLNFDPATQAELDAVIATVTAKANSTDLTAHTTDTSNPHAVTKAQVGLSNVDNTTDAAKPISTATQTALNGKQPLATNLTAISGLSVVNDNVLQFKSGAITSRTIAQFKTDLALAKADVGLANVPNVDATARATHTGTQLASTISDFAVAARTGLLDVSISGTYTPDASYAVHVLNVTNTLTIAAPTSPSIGRMITFLIKHGGTNNTVLMNAIYKDAPWIPTTGNTIWTVTFIYDGANWQFVSTNIPVTSIRAYRAGTGQPINGWTVRQYAAEDYDVLSEWSTSAWTFTPRQAGHYQFSVWCQPSSPAGSGNRVLCDIAPNGQVGTTQLARICEFTQTAASQLMEIKGTTTLALTAGQVVQVGMYALASTTPAFGSAMDWLTINRVNRP